MLDVYYANLMLLSILVVEAAVDYRGVFRSGRMREARDLSAGHVVFVLTAGVAMIPTFLSRWIVYGGPLRSGYVSIRDYLWDAPVFLSVLFSSNHGLLSWTPIAGLAIAGLLLFAIRVPRVGILYLVSLMAFYVFISLYPDWAGISSYGNRFFVSLTALFVLGLGDLLEHFASRFRKLRDSVVISSALMACFILWNVGMIYQWGTHLVPARGPISFREAAYNQIFVVPGQMSSQLRNYFLRRSDMMRNIEQRDIEQQKNAEH